MPRPERCWLCVGTLRYAIARSMSKVHTTRMRFGRSANKSNLVAVFMLQQHRPMPEMKKAAGIFALRPPGSK